MRQIAIIFPCRATKSDHLAICQLMAWIVFTHSEDRLHPLALALVLAFQSLDVRACVRAGGRAVGRLDVNTLKIRIQLNAYYFHEINWQSTQQINENI